MHPLDEASLLILCSVFERIEQRASNDPDKASKTALRKLGRRLRSVHDELAQYTQLIALFQEAPEFDWESLLPSARPTLTQGFFSHLELICRTTSDASRREGMSGCMHHAAALACRGQVHAWIQRSL